jgi:hypothetical protein
VCTETICVSGTHWGGHAGYKRLAKGIKTLWLPLLIPFPPTSKKTIAFACLEGDEIVYSLSLLE